MLFKPLGADALNDLMAGRHYAMFATIPSVVPHIKAGKLKAITVSRAALVFAAGRADGRGERLSGLCCRLVVWTVRPQENAASGTGQDELGLQRRAT